MHNKKSISPEVLLDRILNCNLDDDVCYSNQLLECIWAGYPIINVKRLFRSSNICAVRAGVWIASELGKDATVLIGDIAILLDHEDPYIRFWAIDALIASTHEFHGSVLATAIKRLEDADAGVRWKSMDLISRLPLSLLIATRDAGSKKILNELYVSGLECVISTIEYRGQSADLPRNIMEKINSENNVSHAFGAIAAFHFIPQDKNPFMSLGLSVLPEVQDFFKDALQDLHLG